MSSTKELPSVEYLRQVLDYNPETGIFVWKIDRNYKTLAGDTAGSVQKINKKSGYSRIIICLDYKRYKAHRLAWALMTGEHPPEIIDHIDGNPLNNKWNNLRKATAYENKVNEGIRINNISGIKNVSFHKASNKFRVTIDGKHYGVFASIEEANVAASNLRNKIHGKFARSK